MVRTSTVGVSCVSVLALSFVLTAVAQKKQNEPATDSAAQASPIRPAPAAPVTDAAAEASPVSAPRRSAVWIAPHTPIEVKLGRSIDSGRLKNGDTVPGTLANSVALSPHGALDAGTPVQLTVIETLPAGRIYAAGEFSLQIQRIGSLTVYTNTLTYRGKPGPKDLPDSAPQVGTDAGLPAGAELTFHILPPPTFATGLPRARGRGPGVVTGRTSGAAPPPGSSKQPNTGAGNTKGANARQITPADNSPQPAQNIGQRSPAPNQPAPPTDSNSTQTTQPH